jgi:hypothetical protein
LLCPKELWGKSVFPDDHIIRRLLFELATWHGLAKLHLHTETTLHDLENSTTRLREVLRKFQSDVCPVYKTKHLPSEETARVRRLAAKVKKTTNVKRARTKPKKAAMPESEATTTKPKKKSSRRNLNIATYKMHSLGDYVRSIHEHGTTDNTSSQTVFYFIPGLGLYPF